MENFYNWLTKPVGDNDLEVWLNVNNITKEKVELYFDFSLALYKLIADTTLEDDNFRIDESDRLNHFNWCWKKNISNFEKEKIYFAFEGKHYEYFKDFFYDSFYNQTSNKLKDSIQDFLFDLFDMGKSFTKSDLDMLIEIYKLLDANVNFQNKN